MPNEGANTSADNSMNTKSSLTVTLGKLIYILAVVVSVTIGFHRMPALVSIAVAAVMFEVSFILVRWPQRNAIEIRNGTYVAFLIIFQVFLNTAIAVVFYWIGRGMARLFS